MQTPTVSTSWPFLWRAGTVPSYFQPWNPDQGLAYPLKILFSKNSNFTFALCRLIQGTLVTIVGRLTDSKPFAQFPNRDKTLLIVLVNVVRFFCGSMFPDEPGDADPVVSATNWDYAATAALAGMFTLVFQEPSVNMERFASEPERDGEP